MTLYPPHNQQGLAQVKGPANSKALHVQTIVTCALPLLPPETAGLSATERYSAIRDNCLVCPECGIVCATAEQITQARNAALESGLKLMVNRRLESRRVHIDTLACNPPKYKAYMFGREVESSVEIHGGVKRSPEEAERDVRAEALKWLAGPKIPA